MNICPVLDVVVLMNDLPEIRRAILDRRPVGKTCERAGMVHRLHGSNLIPHGCRSTNYRPCR